MMATRGGLEEQVRQKLKKVNVADKPT